MSLPVQLLQFRGCRTRELRELLEDEDELKRIVRCSEKFQALQRAAEKMLVSNRRLAEASLSQSPKFGDARLLLAVKYRELDRLRGVIRAKQEQLAGKYSVHCEQLCLLKNVNRAEEECELLFQSFAEGETPLADFLDGFLSSRKRHHSRLILVRKLQEAIRLGARPKDRAFPAGSPCQPVRGPTAVVASPPGCRPPSLPFGDLANTARRLPPLPLCVDHGESPRPGGLGRGPKWPTAPERLKPLGVRQRRHRQAPR
ncbi:vacuolar protein sorting-associated protein 37D-like [Xiphias gladius]|uniref:vacuolar protein sorting-associated protein 37D-like n=1 Tax=Xiphias gladius TaxID=8245 RepID=UPI001A991871|nr:vacuolar protein sorting-associated protein 37D-like [Xiphias gladius]